VIRGDLGSRLPERTFRGGPTPFYLPLFDPTTARSCGCTPHPAARRHLHTVGDMAAGQNHPVLQTPTNPPAGRAGRRHHPVLYGDINAHVGPRRPSRNSSNDKLGRAVQSGRTGERPVQVGNPQQLRLHLRRLACTGLVSTWPDARFLWPGLRALLVGTSCRAPALARSWRRWGVSQVTPDRLLPRRRGGGGCRTTVDDSCFDDGTGADPGTRTCPAQARHEPDDMGATTARGGPRLAGATGLGREPAAVLEPPTSDGTPYNIPGTATFRPGQARPERSDAPPDPDVPRRRVTVRYPPRAISATHGSSHLLFNAESDKRPGLTVARRNEVDAVRSSGHPPG